MNIKYNEFGEVISVNGLTTGQHIGTPMQDALCTSEENSAYYEERLTIGYCCNTIDDKQPETSGSSPGGQGGSGGLNIHYGDTTPENTSMLWCKCSVPSDVIVSNIGVQVPMTDMNINSFRPTGSYNLQARVGNNVYLMSSSKILKYNLVTNECITLDTPIPNSSIIDRSAYCVIDANIYIFGGYGKDTIYVFDTITDTFRLLETTFPSILRESCCAVVGNNAYLFGGDTGSYSKKIFKFDISNEIVTNIASLPRAQTYMSCATYENKIYIFGGNYKSGSTTYQSNDIYVYDVETNTITTLTTKLPKAKYSIDAVTLGSKIYLFGGITSSTPTSTICIFDVETEEITTLDNTLIGGSVRTLYGTDFYNFESSGNVYKFSTQAEIPNGTLHIVPTFIKNIFCLNSNPKMDIGVNAILLGNENNTAKPVESYLYKDDAWVQI